MNWHTGIASGIYLNRSIIHMLPLISGAGARGFEVGTPPGHFHPGSAEEVAALARALGEHGLRAISIHAPFGRSFELASTDETERTAAVAAAIDAARALRALGGQIVVAHPSDVERHGQDVGHRLTLALASLRLVAKGVADLGLTLAVESPLPHLIGGHPEEFRWLFANLDASVGACLDTGHAALGGNWDRLMHAVAGRVVHVHASDNHGVRDDHLPPGDGRIDWPEIARSLAAIDYRGWVMLELHGASAEDPSKYLTRAIRQASYFFGSAV